jgi:4-amino-4-deoxy-L-arabinose transferase-like glycosyltransferase
VPWLKTSDPNVRRRTFLAAAIFGGAFLLRLVAGLLKGPDFVENGYGFYADIARTLWSGGGFCEAVNEGCTVRVPVYPLLVAPFLAADIAYPWLIVLQALVGAGTAIVFLQLGRHLIGERVGLLAAAAVAVNPYAVIHGPSFQETVIVNALIGLSILLLIKSAAARSEALCMTAGCTLALAALTTARVVPLVALAVLWVALGSGPPLTRVRRTCVVLLPIVLLVGAWTARNARLVGSPVLTTEAGLSLWLANNPATMEIYPHRSVDEVAAHASRLLGPEDVRRLELASANPAHEDREYAGLAWRYISTNPGQTLKSAALKVAYNFSGWLSPVREWPVQLAFLAVFLPVNVLAAIGLWRHWREGHGHLLVILVVVSLIVTTAVFWSHTSHASYLHGFKFVYAAAVIIGWWEQRQSLAIPGKIQRA